VVVVCGFCSKEEGMQVTQQVTQQLTEVVIPSYSSWFSFGAIHAIEEKVRIWVVKKVIWIPLVNSPKVNPDSLLSLLSRSLSLSFSRL
jgi:hypothetical protein